MFQAFKNFFFKNCILTSLQERMYKTSPLTTFPSRVKAHYTIHKRLSQGNLRKIFKFVIGHVIEYTRLK